MAIGVGGPRDLRRRLIVITYHFPPDGSVGGLRWGGLAKYLARLGWEVHVVTASLQGEAAVEAGVHVHARRASRTLNDVYNGLAARLRASRNFSAQQEPATTSPKLTDQGPSVRGARGIVGRIRRNLATALAFPDYGRGWVLPAASTARALLRRQSFDLVITSGPPHSAHLAGVLACVGRPEPLWVDMRDPWSAMIGKKWAQSAFRSDWVRFMIPRLERLVFRRAQRVITNTPEFADDLRKHFPSMQVSFVPNGIDLERLPAAPEHRFDGLSIVHAGSLYAGRDLSPVLRAMEAFLLATPSARGALMLRLAGNMDTMHEERLRREVAAAGLEANVEMLGRVSGEEAMMLLNRSHLALVLAQDQPTQIPAKLYECVAMGVPTLVIAESTSAAAREAHRVGGMACDASALDTIRDVIAQVWIRASRPTVSIADINYDHISSRLNDLLREVPSRDGADR